MEQLVNSCNNLVDIIQFVARVSNMAGGDLDNCVDGGSIQIYLIYYLFLFIYLLLTLVKITSLLFNRIEQCFSAHVVTIYIYIY